jgi:hypothetical protein
LTWEKARKIDGQKSSVPAIAAFEGKLFMCYNSDASSQLYQSQSDNGWDWHNTKKIDGQRSDAPTLTIIRNQLLMVYPSHDRHDDGQLLQTLYTSQTGWSPAKWISGQKARRVALAIIGE